MRWPNAFYLEVRKHRDVLGDYEYNRDTDLRPKVVELMQTYDHDIGGLYIEAADKILDGMDRADDDAGIEGSLFPIDAHIPLGGKQRIRRGAMGIAEIRRRERIIDTNKANNDAAWAAEKKVNALVIDLLADRPSDFIWRDVLGPDGKPKV